MKGHSHLISPPWTAPEVSILIFFCLPDRPFSFIQEKYFCQLQNSEHLCYFLSALQRYFSFASGFHVSDGKSSTILAPLGGKCYFFPLAIFKKYFIYLYFREGKAGRKRGRETSMCDCLLHAPCWGPGLQPRHVPWLGIEPVTLWFTGPCSVHWATSGRAPCFSLGIVSLIIYP